MAALQQHTAFTAFLSSTSSSVSVGQVLCLDSTGDVFTLSTSAERASSGRRSAGIVISEGDGANNAVELQFVGFVSAEVTGLGAGTATTVSVSATGVLQRGSAGEVVGNCDTDGTAYLVFGGVAGINGITLPFNIDSTTGQYISYGASGDTLPDVLNTTEGPFRLGNSTSVDGTRTGVIQWYTQAGQNVNLLSVVGTATFSTMALGWSGISSMNLFAGEFSFASAAGANPYFYINPDGSNYAGHIFDYTGSAPGRLSIGSTGTSNNASFGGTASGPMIKLHKLQTAPTGNPSHAINPAVWLYYDDSVPSLIVHFKGGEKFTIPATTGTASTSGFTAPTGTGFATVTGGVLDAASLAFPLSAAKGGTGLSALGTNVATLLGTNLAAGFTTFAGTPSSANFASLITGETGTGGVVFDTSASLTTPTFASPTVTGTPVYNGTRLAIKTIVGEVQTSSTTTASVATYTMIDETHCQFDAIVTFARRTNVTKAGTYKLSVGYRRTSAGAPTIVGALVTQTDQETTAGDTVTIDVSSNDVRVRVTAADTDGRNWSCELRVQQTTNA